MPTNQTAYTVHQLPNGSWTVIFYAKVPGTFDVAQILARAPQEFSDRTDAVQLVINMAHLGARDPRTMRKAPKWAAY